MNRTIMNGRRFLRLDEIESKTILTKGDILDAVENKQMSLAATIDVRAMGAIVVTKERQHKLSAVFDYNGMVKLPFDIAKHFAISNKMTPVKKVMIIEPEKVCNWHSVTERFGNIESSRVDYTKAKPSQPTGRFVAFTCVEQGFSGVQMLTNYMLSIAKCCSTQKIENPLIKEDNQPYLQTVSLTIEPERIRVEVKDIVNIFGKHSLSESQSNDNKEGQSKPIIQPEPLIFTHPIKQIVHRVLIDYPDFYADKIWVQIRKDVNQDGPRIYDIDNVIDTITADSVSWFGKGDSLDNEMSYDSFRRSCVYQVKKQIKVNNN